MAWLTYGGKTPSEFDYSIHGGGRISPALLQRRPTAADDIANLVKTLSPTIKQLIQSKNTDRVANALNASESAQRATPVLDNSGQMISGGGPMNAADVSGYNASLGYPGTYQTPDMGGAAGLYLRHQQQLLEDKRQADAVEAAAQERKARLDEANISRLNAPAAPAPGVPVEIGGNTYPVTPDAALRHMDATRPKSKPDSFELLDKDVFTTSGGHLSDWSTARNKRIQGDQFMGEITKPDGTRQTLSMPSILYQRALGRYNALQNPPSSSGSDSGTAQQTNPAAQAFQDAQHQALPAPDLPPVGQSDIPNQPEARVKVIGPDGKVGTIPASQLQQAIQSGYKQAEVDDNQDQAA